MSYYRWRAWRLLARSSTVVSRTRLPSSCRPLGQWWPVLPSETYTYRFTMPSVSIQPQRAKKVKSSGLGNTYSFHPILLVWPKKLRSSGSLEKTCIRSASSKLTRSINRNQRTRYLVYMCTGTKSPCPTNIVSISLKQSKYVISC
jgi:hypothetical protein